MSVGGTHTVEDRSAPGHTDRNTVRQTHTHKSENSISTSFTPFTWRIGL